MIKLNAKELRNYDFKENKRNKKDQKDQIKKNPIYIILDNVLDTYNIGSIFRLADAVAAKQILLCGETQVPPHTRIKKASINTTEWVDWEYFDSAKSAIQSLKCPPANDLQCRAGKVQSDNSKLKVIAIEQDERSIPYTKMNWELPVAVVVGNETYGGSKEVLEMCDSIVEIPMWGVNKSLNVMVSLGIVIYKIIEMRKDQNF